MGRRIAIAIALALGLAAPAGASTTTLMPGVTFSRQVEFTPHGPVALNVLVAPKPGGLWDLKPVLSDNAISGRERVTAMQRSLANQATVAGVNGDFFNAGDGRPFGVLLQNGVLESLPAAGRSSIGIGSNGALDIRRVGFSAFWQGRGQRRPLTGLNQPANPGGISLYTPAWGASTPPAPGALEAVVYPFSALTPGADAAGSVVQFNQGGNTPIPAGGAVFSALGGSGTRLAQEAPPGSRIVARVTLKPAWGGVASALGGGPVLVQNGRPIFRAFEDFAPIDLAPRKARTAVGQRRDGSIVLLAVDGGRPGFSVGVTNFELAQALVRAGCVTGSGLDSGDSTTMAFESQLLNRPSDRSGERAVAEGLFVLYYGVYAAVSDPVLSPNGDGVSDRESLSFKVVRPSNVTARLVGPDGAARYTQTGALSPGTYKVGWSGLKVDGSPDVEGQWHWTVTATDDLGRQSSSDQTFALNNTLGGLHAPAIAAVRPGQRVVVANFTLAHSALVQTTIETHGGVVLRRLGSAQLAAGAARVSWDGKLASGRLAFPGRYLVHVRATNPYGAVDLTQPFTVRRL